MFWNLARSLASRGHEVHVITQRVKGELDSETRSGVRIRRVGLPVEYSGALATSFKDSFAYCVEAFFAGISIAAKRRVDVIHSNTYVPALVAQLCASLLGKKHVTTVHDVYLLSMPWFWKTWSKQSNISLLARVFGPMLETALLKMPVTAIHTVSNASRNDILRIAKSSRVIVVPNGIEVNDYTNVQEKAKTNPHQAIYVGRLVFYKNLEVVFQALTIVQQKIRDARLVIVGDGPMRPVWESLVEKLGLKDHVTFSGRVSHDEKVRLIKESQFLVLPSLVEGFGIVVLEAFACRRPVLVNRIGALQELVANGEDGFLADPTSAQDWADRMVTMFSDQDLVSRIGDNGYAKLIQEYTTDHVARAVESMYKKILGKDDDP